MSGSGELPYPAPRVAWYGLGILILLYTSSFIDRLIVGLLIEPIKADLGASDTLMGLLVGTAFALLYTLMGFPFGRLADRYQRRLIIAGGASVWSVMTMLCGLAGSYWQLFAARLGVGVGAAALTPCAYSMISDLFKPRWLPLAMGIYVMAVAIGSGLAFMIGGAIISLVSGAEVLELPLIGPLKPWQVAFVAAGLPGLPLAALMLTVREPLRRGLLTGADGVPAGALPLSEVIRFVVRRWRSYAALIVPACLLTMLSYAFAAWIPAYFIRVHGWSAGQAGVLFGLCILLTGVAATLSGGALCSWLLARGRSGAYLRVLLYAAIGLLPLASSATLFANQWVALAALAAFNFFSASWGGPVAAGMQALTPNQMRGQMSALYLFAVNITGLALGPLLVGVLTDYYFGAPQDVKYSMAIAGVLLTPPAIGLLLLGRGAFRRGIEEAAAWT